jgi:hypothetical protein
VDGRIRRKFAEKGGLPKEPKKFIDIFCKKGIAITGM